MLKIAGLIAGMAFFACFAQANEETKSRIQAGWLEFSDRLELSSAQESQIRSIIEEHLKSQIEILQKHEMDVSDRDKDGDVDLKKMRTLREELSAGSAEVERQLAEVLSASQIAEFKRIRAEREQKIRDQFLSILVDEIGAKLELTTEQTDQAKPILKAHFESQTAVLDKHGISLGGSDSDKRYGFRTLRRLRKELNQLSTSTERLLSAVLTEVQQEDYAKLQKEQRKKLRAQLKQR